MRACKLEFVIINKQFKSQIVQQNNETNFLDTRFLVKILLPKWFL